MAQAGRCLPSARAVESWFPRALAWRAAASDATFAGDYAMVGLSYDYATPAMRSFGGGLAAEGAGHATAQGTTNTEGTIAATLPVDHTSTVAADGALTLETPEGSFVGGVAPSGNLAVVGGPDTDGAPPAMYLLVRR